MHFESIDRPISFAKKVRDALSVLTTREVQPKEEKIDIKSKFAIKK